MRIKLLLLLMLMNAQLAVAGIEIQTWKTSTGSEVYYVYAEGLPMVDIQVIFDAGSARDVNQHGIAALTTALLDTGAGEWNADAIAQRFDNVGAQYGASISKDSASFSLRTLTQADLFDQAIETLHVILTDPKFNVEDFQREKNRLRASLKHREELPGALAGIAFNQLLYGDHPYAHPTAGFIETVSKFKADDLRTFYQTYYVAANAIFVIVGDIPQQQAAQTVEKLSVGLKVGQKPEVLPMVKIPADRNMQHIEFPSKQTHVLSGLLGTHRKDEDYFPLYVGNHILGGSGLVSKIFSEIREKRGLAYSSYSYFSPMFRKGPFTMGLQTRNDQAEKALSVLDKTLQDFIDQGPSEQDLLAAKKNITGGFVLRFDTNNKLTNYVAMIGFYKLPLNYLDTFQQKVVSVTKESIREAFQRRVDPRLLQTVTVGVATKASEE